MGRNTFNSLPKMLPNRRHLILTDRDDFNKDIENSEVFYNFQSLLARVEELSKEKDVYIIGGASIYKQFIEFADVIILTQVLSEDKEADVYFPQFNKEKYDINILGHGEDNGIYYNHVVYHKKKQ